MRSVDFAGTPITPSKVVCIGRNYVEHIHELGNEIPSSMVVFNKPNSAITDTLYFFTPTTRFEGEICFLINHGEIAGVGFGLDLTHAHIQNHLKEKGLPWERAKAFDNSAVFSPFVSFKSHVSTLSMRLTVNETVAQEADISLMIYKPKEMIEEIENFMTLEDGDIIMTGTPKGVSTYAKGDIFKAEIFSDEALLLTHTWIAEPYDEI